MSCHPWPQSKRTDFDAHEEPILALNQGAYRIQNPTPGLQIIDWQVTILSDQLDKL